MLLWVQKWVPKQNPGKWQQKLKPRNPSSSILSHTHILICIYIYICIYSHYIILCYIIYIYMSHNQNTGYNLSHKWMRPPFEFCTWFSKWNWKPNAFMGRRGLREGYRLFEGAPCPPNWWFSFLFPLYKTNATRGALEKDTLRHSCAFATSKSVALLERSTILD